MAIYRRATAVDREKYIDFANMVFSMAHVPHNFKALLPKIYADGRVTDDMHSIAVQEDGSIVGLVAMLEGELQLSNTTLKTGYVGTVSAHPFHRGEGHMKALMNMTLERAREDHLDLLMLGGQRQRYGYFGFTQGGLQVSYSINNSNIRHALKDVQSDDIRFVPMRGAEDTLIDRAYAMHAARHVRANRTREDFIITLESWMYAPMLVFRGEAMLGYLVASASSEDISELVLARDTDVPAVIKAWKNAHADKQLTIPAAAYDLALNRQLSAFAEYATISHAQMLKALNFPRVLEALLPLSGALRPLADGRLSMVIDGKPITVQALNGAVSVTEAADAGAVQLTSTEAQNLLLNPLGGYTRQFGPSGWFPLPLYLDRADEF